MSNTRITLYTKKADTDDNFEQDFMNLDESLTIKQLKEKFIEEYLRESNINLNGKVLLTENVDIFDDDFMDLDEESPIRNFITSRYRERRPNIFFLTYREPLYTEEIINNNNRFIHQPQNRVNVIENNFIENIKDNDNRNYNIYRQIEERPTAEPEIVNQNLEMDSMFDDTRQGFQQQQQQSRQVEEITAQLEAQINQIREKNRQGLLNPKLNIIKRRLQLYDSNQVPNEFIGPITLEIMIDPVITADGHSFERSAIEMWFQNGRNLISPKTNQRLPNGNLIPNIALRSRIQDWISGYNQDMEGGGFDF
jgi:hypothetical protein